MVLNYKHSSYDNYTHLPLSLVQKAIAEGWEYSLCYFVWMRKVHRKPVFYNYTTRSIAKYLKCSHVTIAHHIAILKEKGFVEVNGGNLVLKGSTALKKAYKSILVPVLVCSKRNDQLTALRFATVKKNLHNQDKAIDLKKDIIKLHESPFTKYKDAKRLLKAQSRLNFEVETSTIDEKLSLSNKKLGMICNRSQRTGVKIQKALNDIGLVKTSRDCIIIEKGHNRRSFFSMELPSKFLLTGTGDIIKCLPNRWTLPDAQRCMQ